MSKEQIVERMKTIIKIKEFKTVLSDITEELYRNNTIKTIDREYFDFLCDTKDKINDILKCDFIQDTEKQFSMIE